MNDSVILFILLMCLMCLCCMYSSLLLYLYKQKHIKPLYETVVSIKKVQGSQNTELLDIKDIDPNKVYLTLQTSIDPCIEGQTFGINDDNSIYVKNKCHGIFTYKGAVGLCVDEHGTDTDAKAICNIGIPTISNTGLPLGLIPAKLELIQDKSNGKCTSGNYGLINYNTMYTKNGCSGMFRYGSLIGNCLNNKSINVTDKNKENIQICPIGKTDPTNEWSGLYITSISLQVKSDNDTCIHGINTMDQNIAFKDRHTLVTKGNCSGNFMWGLLGGKCVSGKDCPIGLQASNGADTVGLIPWG